MKPSKKTRLRESAFSCVHYIYVCVCMYVHINKSLYMYICIYCVYGRSGVKVIGLDGRRTVKSAAEEAAASPNPSAASFGRRKAKRSVH